MQLLLLAGLVGLFCTLALRAQVSSVTGSGTVEGSIVCNDGNVPGRGATVALIPLSDLLPSGKEHPAPTKKSVTHADFDGRFILTQVPEGTYVIDARKDGYADDLDLVRLVLAKLKPEQQTELLAGFPQASVRAGGDSEHNLVLHRAASLSGRLLVDDGGTLEKTPVTAVLVSSPIVGDLSDTPNFIRSALTNDLGDFRIAGLPAGKYRVSAQISEAFIELVSANADGMVARVGRTGTAELQVFSPDTVAEAHAKLVSIKDGDDASDVDITVPLNKLHSISGKVIGPGGKPISGMGVRLQPQGGKPMDTEAISDPSGAYRFDLLPAGTYTLAAMGPSRGPDKERLHFGEITVLLGDSNVSDANITTHP